MDSGVEISDAAVDAATPLPQPADHEPGVLGTVISTAICAFFLFISMMGQSLIVSPTVEGESAAFQSGYFVGRIVGGVLVASLLWAICYAIVIRKAPRKWKIGSWSVLAVLGGLQGLIIS